MRREPNEKGGVDACHKEVLLRMLGAASSSYMVKEKRRKNNLIGR